MSRNLSLDGSLIPAHVVEPSSGVTCGPAGKYLYVGYGATVGATGFSVFERKRAFEDVACGEVCRRDVPPLGQRGDSGGPLFRILGEADDPNALHVVCGVASFMGVGGLAAFGPIRWARTNYDTNLAFIEATAKDDTGYWAGEHPAPGPAYPDGDSDGVPDGWDNCPGVPNADQGDADDDTVGDACDNCTYVPNRDQSNANGDEEFRKAGDSCDKVPLTKISTSGDKPLGGPAPRYVSCSVRTPETSCSVGTGSCPVSKGNRFQAESFLGDNATTVDEQRAGLVAVRMCPCPEGRATPDCEDDPAYACPRKGATLDRRNPGGGWFAPDLRTPGGAKLLEDSSYGRVWLRTTHNNVAKGLGAELRDFYWDYRFYKPLDLPSASAPYNVVLKGIVWAWVKNHTKVGASGPTPDEPPTDDDYLDREVVRQTVTRIDVSEVFPSGIQESPFCIARKIVPLPRVPIFLPDAGGWRPPPCSTCGWRSRSFALRFVYPTGAPPTASVASFESDDRDVTASFDSSVLSAMSGDANAMVLAPDPEGYVKGSYVGAQIEASTHRVIAALRIDAGRLVADPVSAGSGLGPLLAVASGRRQQVAFIGERDAGGVILQQLRVYDLPSGTFTTQPLNVSEFALVDPVAATYVAQDDTYYVLDRSQDGTRSRLLRIPLTNVVHLVGEWSRSGGYASVALTATPRGQLVISTWNSSAHNVAVLSLESDGPQLIQLQSGLGELSEPAFGGNDGVFLSRLSGGEPQPLERLPDAWLVDRLEPDLLGQVF